MAMNVSTKLMGICKLVLIALNIFFMFISLLVIGLSIYLLLYKGDLLAVIFNMPTVSSSCIILIFCGSFVLIMSIVGLCAASTLNKYLLGTYLVLMLLLGLLAIATAIMGMVFRNTWYIDQLRLQMRDVLQQQYGVNMNQTRNKFITRTWDTVQQFWYCCGVEDSSWGTFRQSQWYNNQPGDPGTKEFTAKMVPESCCVKNQYGNYINLQKCQNWLLGPPNKQSGIDTNEAVFYNGCFSIGRNLLVDIANGVIGLGLCLGIVTIVGAVIAFILLMGLRSNSNYPAAQKKPGFYLQPPQQQYPGYTSDGDRSGDRSTLHSPGSPVELQPLEKSW